MNALFIAPIAALVVTLIAAAFDWRTGTIPNWLTFSSILAAPPVLGLTQGSGALGASLFGLVACGVTPYLLFTRNAMGGGDVKLFAALGAIAGVKLGVEIQLISFVVAAVCALGVLTWRGKLGRTLLNALWILANLMLPRRYRREVRPELMATVRMGGAILAATAVTIVCEYPALWL
jgi:prepilin peptidase CpaA